MDNLIGQATPEQIAAWKAAHPSGVFEYQVENRICYLRSVDRDTYALAAAKVRDSGPAKFNDVVVERIWLGGDSTIRDNDAYWFGLVEFIDELMAKKKGSLKQL